MHECVDKTKVLSGFFYAIYWIKVEIIIIAITGFITVVSYNNNECCQKLTSDLFSGCFIYIYIYLA